MRKFALGWRTISKGDPRAEIFQIRPMTCGAGVHRFDAAGETWAIDNQ
jgi:hypothetical protein